MFHLFSMILFLAILIHEFSLASVILWLWVTNMESLSVRVSLLKYTHSVGEILFVRNNFFQVQTWVARRGFVLEGKFSSKQNLLRLRGCWMVRATEYTIKFLRALSYTHFQNNRKSGPQFLRGTLNTRLRLEFSVSRRNLGSDFRLFWAWVYLQYIRLDLLNKLITR